MGGTLLSSAALPHLLTWASVGPEWEPPACCPYRTLFYPELKGVERVPFQGYTGH